MDNNRSENQKAKAGFFLTLVSLISLILFPLFIAVPILFGLLTCSDFYTGVLRNSRLIETYVEASNWQVEKKLRRQIESSVHLDEFRTKYDTIKGLYEKKKENYDNLNRTMEFDKLKKERKKLSGLSYENAPDRFKSEPEFDNFKTIELERLERAIDEIKLQRDINKAALEAAEDELEESEEVYADARDTLEDKMEEANDIIRSQKDTFSGEMYGDMEIAGPVLSQELNGRLIDGGVKNEIEKYISFFTSYYDQKRLGNVYVDRMENYVNGLYGSASVKLPEIDVSLYVEDMVNGVLQKRHIGADIFVEKISDMRGLKLQNKLIQLFKFTESGMAEILGESYLKEYNCRISDGTIAFGPWLLTGPGGTAAEYMMIVSTWGKYLKFVLPALAILILVFLFLSPAEKNLGRIHVRTILLLPSVLIVLFSIAAVFFSGNLLDFFPDLVSSPVLLQYYKSIIRVIALYLFAPLAAVFGVFALAGIILKRRRAS